VREWIMHGRALLQVMKDGPASEVMEKVGQTTEDRRLSLQPVLCQGACGLAPVMGVDQDNHGGMALRRVEGFSTGIGER